jgi:hypothetical protein
LVPEPYGPIYKGVFSDVYGERKKRRGKNDNVISLAECRRLGTNKYLNVREV